MVKQQPRNKNTFAYFSYPVTRECLKALWPLSGFIPDAYFKKYHPFKVFPVKGIKDARGNHAQGYFITRCYLEEYFKDDMNKADAYRDVQEASRIAHRLGAKILGLGGFPAALNQGPAVRLPNTPVPVTSGNALFAWSVFESIYWVCRQKKMEFSRVNLAVLGADSSLGILCSRKFAGSMARLVLSGDDLESLQALKQKIAAHNPTAVVIIEQDVRKAQKDADVVIICDIREEGLFHCEDLHPGGIVCDVSSCGLVRANFKPSHGCVLVKSGLVKLPQENNFLFNSVLGKNVICASFAEVILLALQNKFLPFAQGGDTNLDKLEEIADFAASCGFEMWFQETAS